jgi:hypothetical protein
MRSLPVWYLGNVPPYPETHLLTIVLVAYPTIRRFKTGTIF